MTPAPITEFRGPYRFLSNFYYSPIVVEIGGGNHLNPYADDPTTYLAHTVEHAFQALKADNPDQARWVIWSPTPGEAKRRGRRVMMRPDWDAQRITTMASLLSIKFAAGSELARWLLATGDAALIEGNTWGDQFWGVAGGKGENNLGKLLMIRRAQLMAGVAR